jgi:hypothetical protein
MSSTIPSKDFDFNVTQEILFSSAEKNAKAWELDSNWITNVLRPEKEKWDKAWAVYSNPATCTPLAAFTKSLVRKEYEPFLEILVCNLETNIHITDDERRNMGVVTPFKKRKYVLPPEIDPGFVIGTSIIRNLTIHFFDKKTLLSKRPHGASGAEMQWAILDNPPASAEELTNHKFTVRPPFVLQFEESERGETVYLRLRWKGNTEGNGNGPWSEIMSGIIP